MKNMILVGIVLSFMSFATVGLAGTVGNIAETQGGLGKFSLGVEYDGVFDRDLDLDSIMPPLGPGESIKDAEFESNRIFAKGTLGLHPNLDIFVKFGAADADGEFKFVDPSASTKFEFDGDWDFAWGIGAKAKLFQSPSGIRLMADIQYLWYEVDGDIKVNGIDLAITGPYDAETEIQEWQVALYVNKTIGMFSPYAGVKYSDMDVETDIDSQSFGKLEIDFEADDNFGIFLGTDFYAIPNILSFNIEGRFVDEIALSVGLNWRF